MGLAEKIKKLLEEQNMSQRELAEKAVVSQATVSRLLTGAVTNVTRQTLDKIGNVLGVTAAYLLGEEETPAYMFRGYEKLSPQQKALLRMFWKTLTTEERQESGEKK